jgi:hypothetical protein
MRHGEHGNMTTTAIVSVNLLISAFVVSAVAALVWLAHRLPETAPHHDEQWGGGGDPWVVSDPLPLHQVARHEAERALARAA